MTDNELHELLADCPTLFHMAEAGSWPSIRQYGLLSTTALLDRYKVKGNARSLIEAQRRSSSVTLEFGDVPPAVVRDQLPMDDNGLFRALPSRLKPGDWYRLPNGRVFFWLTRERLSRLLKAGTYRSKSHDVLELDARRLVERYSHSVWLCPINSGCTKPFPHPRDETTFQRITQYPYSTWRKKRRRGERAVELAIDYAVPDIADFIRRVSRVRGDDELEVLFDGGGT